MRRIAKSVITGRTPPSAAGDFFTEGEIPWFTPGDFNSLVLEQAEKALTANAFSEGYAVLYEPCSILLVGIGATLGKVAISFNQCASNQKINAITTSSNTFPMFFVYFLHCFHDEVRMLASGNTLPILNQDKTKSIIVIRPPLTEQEQITEFLQNTNNEIEQITKKIKNSITLLNEHRSTLITTAITGKMEIHL